MSGSAWRSRCCALAAWALAGLIVADAWQLLQRHRYNAALRDPAAADRPGAAFAFIRAQAAARAGRLPEAWGGYQEAAADPHWAVAALYNSGNLHLRAAVAAAQDGAPMAAVITAAELAKQQYREALRLDPQHGPSRYQLERSTRLVPDDTDSVSAAPPPPSERAIATMRGFTLGLP